MLISFTSRQQRRRRTGLRSRRVQTQPGWWRNSTGYRSRASGSDRQNTTLSCIEAKMRCLKSFGERIAARQTAEIRIALTNRFNALGTAEIDSVKKRQWLRGSHVLNVGNATTPLDFVAWLQRRNHQLRPLRALCNTAPFTAAVEWVRSGKMQH